MLQADASSRKLIRAVPQARADPDDIRTMNTLTSLASYAAAAADRSGVGRSVGLDAQLDAARRQLQDRMSRSSAKTPEGKAKIREVADRLAAIRHAADQAAAEAEAARAREASETAWGTTLGGTLDTYA